MTNADRLQAQLTHVILESREGNPLPGPSNRGGVAGRRDKVVHWLAGQLVTRFGTTEYRDDAAIITHLGYAQESVAFTEAIRGVQDMFSGMNEVGEKISRILELQDMNDPDSREELRKLLEGEEDA